MPIPGTLGANSCETLLNIRLAPQSRQTPSEVGPLGASMSQW